MEITCQETKFNIECKLWHLEISISKFYCFTGHFTTYCFNIFGPIKLSNFFEFNGHLCEKSRFFCSQIHIKKWYESE